MFRRGIKTWAEQTSLRVRQKLKLLPASPLDPFPIRRLALVFQVLSSSDLADFIGRGQKSFSGGAPRVLVGDNSLRVVQSLDRCESCQARTRLK